MNFALILFLLFLFPHIAWGTVISFQPAASPLVGADKKDDGSVFSATRGYGWDRDMRTNTRDRGGVDPLKRSFVFAPPPMIATWSYNLANGDYMVSVLSGDYNFSQGPQRVIVEGIVVINNVSSPAGQFLSPPAIKVTITDGQLTVRIGGGGGNTLLNAVTVVPVAAPPTTGRSIELRWTDNTATETGFRIERRRAQDSTFTLLHVTPANTQVYTDPIGTTTTQYCYRVRAQNATTQSAPSNVACTLAAPTAMTATARTS